MDIFTFKGRVHTLRNSATSLGSEPLSATYERVARAANFPNWSAFRAALESLGDEAIEAALSALSRSESHQGAYVEPKVRYPGHTYTDAEVLRSRCRPRPSLNPPSTRIDPFHIVQVEGHYFWAFAASRLSSLFFESAGGTSYIGDVGMLYEYSDGDWAYCKYGPMEARINLSLISTEGVQTLAREFGLRLIRRGQSRYDGQRKWWDIFSASPAYRGLLEWGRQHPRIIARLAKAPCGYAGNWAAKVQAHIRGARA